MVPASLAFVQRDNTTITVMLDGAWTLNATVPELSEFDALAPRIDPALLQFETGTHFQWDSRLLAFLLAASNALKHRGYLLDPKGLGAEVQALYTLATSVPPSAKEHKASLSFIQRIEQWLGNIGDAVLGFLAFLGDLMIAFAAWIIGKGSTRFSEVLRFCQQCGPSALPIITLQSALVGMILAYLGVVQLRQFGAEIYVPDLVAVGMVREMGALMTAVVMSGRTGAAYAAELGTMQVNEEIDALITMGIKPMEFLVLPRTIALVLMIPLLTMYSNILGILGGGLVATSMDISWLLYLNQLEGAFDFTDLFSGLFKSLIFGVLIAIAGCRSGMACGRSSEAVGKATTEAVVHAIIYLVVADAALNILYFHMGI